MPSTPGAVGEEFWGQAVGNKLLRGSSWVELLVALLAPFWVLLGALLASLRVLLVALRCLLGLSWLPFGSSWGSLSFLLGALGGPLGHP